MTCEVNPKKILLFCGKRKSGKDFLTEWLQNHLNLKSNQAVIVRLSGPLKECYAENHGLDYSRLLDSSDYKEKYRCVLCINLAHTYDLEKRVILAG